MQTTTAERWAWDALADHGLQAEGWTFGWDRAVTRFGRCSYERKRITLSRPLVERNSEDHVRDTILHEVAHALAGAEAGHGPAWRRVAREVGARPERCAPVDTVKVPPRWHGVCSSCGETVATRHRLTATAKRAMQHVECWREPAAPGMRFGGQVVWSEAVTAAALNMEVGK